MNLSAFLDAADAGLVDALTEGIDAGLDVNAADPDGWTALLTAVRGNQTDAVVFLLERGADVRATKAGGCSHEQGRSKISRCR